LTVTVNMQVFELPDASTTVHVTVVTPLAKADPLAGRQLGVPTPEQLSLTVGANVTTAEQTLGSVLLMMGAGQVIDGGCVSLIVTVALPVTVAGHPFESIAEITE
jgi:hypothetical protein